MRARRQAETGSHASHEAPAGLRPTGFDPARIEAEILPRAREAAIAVLEASSQMSLGASESYRVGLRLGHDDQNRMVQAILRFCDDLAKSLDEITPTPDPLLVKAREMAAEESRRAWSAGPDASEVMGRKEADAYLSGIRDHFGQVRHRYEGLLAASAMSAGTAETPQEVQGEARQRDPAQQGGAQHG